MVNPSEEKGAAGVKKIGATALHRTVTRQAEADGVAVARSKKWVGATALFELFSAAVDEGIIDAYYVKGGFSVELRHPGVARTSEDIDLVIAGTAQPVVLLEKVISNGWADFDFRLKRLEERSHSIRVELQVRFNTVDWCTLKVDILGDPIYETEHVEPPDLVRFGLPRPSAIPCLSRAQQLAQWIHCITRPEVDRRRPDRARNIVDLYLFDQYSPCDDGEVLTAAESVFRLEGTHSWPPVFEIPPAWMVTLDEWANELELQMRGGDLVEYFYRFIARLLGTEVQMTYDYRFYVLSYATSRKRLESVDSVPEVTDTFVADPSLGSFRRAIEEGFRIVQMLPFDPARGIIAVLERPRT